MKKRRNIIIIISIFACICTAIFMFKDKTELNLVQTQSNEELALANRKEFFKDTLVSIAAGGAIYCIFYAIPHEYQEVNSKSKSEN